MNKLRSQDRRRRGATLVIVLVCAVIALGLLASGIRGTLRMHRNQKVLLNKQQIELMIDAGIKRATEQLQSDGEYQGEMWDVSKALADERPATIEISVQQEQADLPPTITVRARIGRPEHALGIQRSHRFQFQVNEQQPSSGEE